MGDCRAVAIISRELILPGREGCETGKVVLIEDGSTTRSGVLHHLVIALALSTRHPTVRASATARPALDSCYDVVQVRSIKRTQHDDEL